MKLLKSLAPILPYLTVGIGLFWARSAWVAILGYHAGILVVLHLARFRASFGAKQHAGRWSALSVTLGLSGIALFWLWPLFGISPRLASDLELLGLSGRTWPLFIAYGSLVNPWLEEWYWRGYLGNPAKHPVWMDALFAGFHVLVLMNWVPAGWVLFAVLILCAAGWFFRQAARESGGLPPAALGHAAADFSILVVAYFYSVK